MPVFNPLTSNLFTALQEIQRTGGMPTSARVPANQWGPSFQTINKGSLMTFRYLYAKNDPTPLLLVTDIFNDYCRGLNIHYLSFPYIINLLQANCENKLFSYALVKNNKFLVDSFRQYKRLGIKQPRKLECQFLVKVLQTVRTIDPTQVEAIRRAVRDQINRTVNPPAQPTEEQPITGV